MIESPQAPRIDQWLIRCQPRDSQVRVVDYAPRTETASDLATPIQIKKTDEESSSVGLSVDGSYGHAIRASGGFDRGEKSTNSIQFDRLAPVQAVTASGTINRGRGVYFKLRWTARQVLEGEKTFRLTFQVSPQWRGSLMDVSVVAQSERKALGTWERKPETIGSDEFVVAIYRQGDQQAAEHARALSLAEDTIREVAAEQRPPARSSSLPVMLRQVAMKLELEPDPHDLDWMQRLLLEQADPHLDREISKLPMPVRVAVLDYDDKRDAFYSICDQPCRRFLAAKPAVP
jgi:hypothetical protein